MTIAVKSKICLNGNRSVYINSFAEENSLPFISIKALKNICINIAESLYLSAKL
jgi:hypothetical protein